MIMVWDLIWDSRVYDDLDAIDVAMAERIVKKVTAYLVQNPISLGKMLSANLSGFYSYRFGDYRIIYKINLSQKQITILNVAHRKDVYEI